MLRIIGGERRGARIQAPPGLETRPLRDRVRESLFNILQGRIAGAAVLDLFAGSGAMGLEALSRGARCAAFVEASPRAAAVLRANAARLRYEDRARLVEGRLPGALASLAPPAGGFGLVFIMPPYHGGAGTACLEALSAPGGAASADALAVLEIHRDEPLPSPPGWRLSDDRLYGITRLAFWERG